MAGKSKETKDQSTDNTPAYVMLSAVGNPDFRQAEDIGVPTRKRRVVSFRGAVVLCRLYISENDLGGGNWTGGQVFNKQNQQIARVSYNGRVWDMSDAEIFL